MREFVSKLINCVFPVTCCGCGKDLPHGDRFRVCADCLADVGFIDGLFCEKCGIPLPDGGARCWQCRKGSKYHFEYIRSCVEYSGLSKELILKFKYRNMHFLDRFLGRLLASGIEHSKELLCADVIVPVPMHWLKKLRRGYNQAELLAGAVAEYTGKPVETGWLRRKRFTKPQFGLKKEERARNLSGGFSSSTLRKYKGASVLLIDDICTTGATIEHCARSLKSAGAGKVFALTVARDV